MAMGDRDYMRHGYRRRRISRRASLVSRIKFALWLLIRGKRPGQKL